MQRALRVQEQRRGIESGRRGRPGKRRRWHARRAHRMGTERAMLQVIGGGARDRRVARCADIGRDHAQALGGADLDRKQRAALDRQRMRPRRQHRAAEQAAQRKERDQPTMESGRQHRFSVARSDLPLCEEATRRRGGGSASLSWQQSWAPGRARCPRRGSRSINGYRSVPPARVERLTMIMLLSPSSVSGR